jgi:hypothetical protein
MIRRDGYALDFQNFQPAAMSGKEMPTAFSPGGEYVRIEEMWDFLLNLSALCKAAAYGLDRLTEEMYGDDN